jgi:hypothetical protein
MHHCAVLPTENCSVLCTVEALPSCVMFKQVVFGAVATGAGGRADFDTTVSLQASPDRGYCTGQSMCVFVCVFLCVLEGGSWTGIHGS